MILKEYIWAAILVVSLGLFTFAGIGIGYVYDMATKQNIGCYEK